MQFHICPYFCSLIFLFILPLMKIQKKKTHEQLIVLCGASNDQAGNTTIVESYIMLIWPSFKLSFYFYLFLTTDQKLEKKSLLCPSWMSGEFAGVIFESYRYITLISCKFQFSLKFYFSLTAM